MLTRCAILIVVITVPSPAADVTVTPRLHHLRVAGEREWSDFPAKPEGPSLSVPFRAERNEVEWALRLRQQDVKQTWKVSLNGKDLGRLATDENDTAIYLPVPAGAVVAGENRLVVEQAGRTPDDVRVGEITLHERPVEKILNEGTVEVSVVEAGRAVKDTPIPCRVTVLDSKGSLMTVGAKSGKGLAVRPGVVYTADGKARFGLPGGEYTIHAGRGFEYGIDTVRVTVRPGDTVRKTLSIRRELSTEGYVSCDTHLHCLTHSGHGDATLDERVIALAGEGIELPIATEHNKQIDYHEAAQRQGVRRYFTPVVGNEVTTGVGHFNIFPVKAGDRVPDHRGKDWKTVFKEIEDVTKARIVVLNHPRDVHSTFRPFGAERHIAPAGGNLDGWELRANAVEVVNSGAQQTDSMRLFHDWFGMLNRGVALAPVGASDSHDVSRFLAGQARTYVRCQDDDPGKIDVDDAVANFARGRVLVSAGLLAEITVNEKFGPGELAPAAAEVKVKVRVQGPGWVTAEKVELFANGRKVREAKIADGKRAGVKWSGEWTLPRFRHDVHLVAVASGPGVTEPYWPIAKPYQPTSPVVASRVIGATGAVWVDADGDGKPTSARGHAERLLKDAGDDREKLVRALAECDESVSIQAASLLRAREVSVWESPLRELARKAGGAVERGFQAYAEAWRESQIARGRGR